MTRPQIKVPYQTIDLVVEVLSVTLLLLTCIYTLNAYYSLPDTIPTHFNAKGQADDFGSKVFIFIIPAIALALYIGMFILNKYPHLHNYMVNITEDNALKNYRFSTRVLRLVNFFCVALMAYISYAIVESAKGETFNLGAWLIPVVIAFSIVLPIVLIVYMKKLNR